MLFIWHSRSGALLLRRRINVVSTELLSSVPHMHFLWDAATVLCNRLVLSVYKLPMRFGKTLALHATSSSHP